jgi:hypothetical protein
VALSGYAKRVDRDVTHTLAALERKLAELERELTRLSGGGTDPGETAALYSRAIRGAGQADIRTSSGFATSEPSSRTASPPVGPPGAGVLIDEAVERRYSMEAQETVFGEIPATRDERESIELDDLVRFREKMQSTLQGLIDEYSRLLSIRPPQQ